MVGGSQDENGKGESVSSISRAEGHESSFSESALNQPACSFQLVFFFSPICRFLGHSFLPRYTLASPILPTMRSASVLVLAATALGLVDATNNFLTPYGALGKRQAFDPDESTGSGSDCVEAFGEGYIECRAPTDSERRLCINPDLGETCCEASCTRPSHSSVLLETLICNRGLPCRFILSSRRPLLP